MAVLKDFYANKLRVRVFDTRQAMGECAGNEAAACISLNSMGYPFLLVGGGVKNNSTFGMDSMLRKPSDKLTVRSVYANEKQKIRLRKRGNLDDGK